MKVERCPHCKSMVMFAGEYCSHCRKHRLTGALMDAGEMKARLEAARKVATKRTSHDQEAINQESRVNTASLLGLIAGIAVTLNSLQTNMPYLAVVGVAMFFGGLQLYLRKSVKFVALFLTVASGFFLVLRAMELVRILSQAGLMIAGAMPMWVIWSGLFLILLITSFKILVHDPDKDATPPPAPDGPPLGEPPKQSGQQAGDKA
jgi:hypothetical protein